MTNYELRKMSLQTAKDFAEILKTDEELLDLLYPPRFMGIEEASAFSNLPVKTIYNRINEIPHIKQGKRLVFTDRGLTRWLKRKPSVTVELGIKEELKKAK